MYRNMLTLASSLLLIGFALRSAAGQVVDFEDLTPAIEYSGPGGGHYEYGANMENVGASTGGWGETIHHNVFADGGVVFKNDYVPGWGSWSGWSYSSTTDTTTAGFTNQFSACALEDGGGHNSDNYGVYSRSFSDPAPTIDFGGPVMGLSAWLTNTTYAYLAVVEGDDGANFVKGPFGAGDWFKTTVWGFDASGTATTSVDIYLADYTDADPDNWYALNTWTHFDLSSLGTVHSLGFDFESTDTGPYGMNTPGYFAMDSLTFIPEPTSLLMLLCGAVVGMVGFGRRRRQRGK